MTSQGLQIDRLAMVDLSHQASPALDTIIPIGAFEHGLGSAAQAHTEEAPDLYVDVQRLLLGQLAGARSDHLGLRYGLAVLRLGPLQQLFEHWRLVDHVALDVCLPC